MPLFNFRVNPLSQNFFITIGNDEKEVQRTRFENEMRARAADGIKNEYINEHFRVDMSSAGTKVPEIGLILASSMQRIVNVLFLTTGIGYNQYLIALHHMYYDDDLNTGPIVGTRRIYHYLPHNDLIDVIYISGFSKPVEAFGQVTIINSLPKQSY